MVGLGDSRVRAAYADASLTPPTSNNADFVARSAKLPLAEQPGTRWDYGHSTDVLGRVIEVISGKSLFQFEKERLLDPLGMSETSFFVADPAKRSRIAEPLPHDRAINPTTQMRDPMQPRIWESGGGGMVGTIADYARFAQMLLNGGTFEGRRYLKAETVALMASDHIGPETKIARDQFYFPGPDQRLRPRLCRAHDGAAEHAMAARRISLGRRRRHLLLHRSHRRHVRHLHGADALAARPHPTGAEDADLSGDGEVSAASEAINAVTRQ